MIEDIQNRLSHGFDNEYPNNLIDTYNFLTNYKTDTHNLARLLYEGMFEGVSFHIEVQGNNWA